VQAANLENMGGSSASPLRIDDPRDLLSAETAGPALILVTRQDNTGNTVVFAKFGPDED
jgi:hypothetical protein